nr:hypothetical protein [Tanacetum cinerariifolium]
AGQLVVAKEAVAAGDGERHYHAVAALEVAHALAHFLHDAHELVPEHHWGSGQRAVVDVQVGAANGRARHANDGVARVFERGVIYCIDADVAGAVKHEGFHGNRRESEEKNPPQLTAPKCSGCAWQYLSTAVQLRYN